jgi:two-component system, OmpR family, sensor histidine kinase KdpD
MTGQKSKKQRDLEFRQTMDRLSHSLRTPLTSMKAAASLLRHADTLLDEEARQELVAIIDEEADRLNIIIDKLTLVTCVELGKLALDRSPQRLENLLQVAVEKLEEQLQAYKLSINLAEDLPIIRGDFDLLSKVLVYVLENAMKYSKFGSTIEFTAQQVDNKLCLSVTDHGVGIEPDNLDKVFTGLYRSEAVEKQHRKGTGISLAICRGIIEAHKGHIWAENNSEDNGTTIKMEIEC